MAKSKKVITYGQIILGNNYLDISKAVYQEGLPEEIFLGRDMRHLMARGMPAGTSVKLTISGEEVGAKYKEFFVELRGVAVYESVKGPRPLCLIFSGEPRSEWLVQVFKTDIYIRGIAAHIRQLWYPLIGWDTTIENIKGIPGRNQSTQIARLSKGLDIVTDLIKRGRKRKKRDGQDVKLNRFVVRTNKLKNTAWRIHRLVESSFSKEWENLSPIINDDKDLQTYCVGHDTEKVKEVAKITAERWKNKRNRKWKFYVSPMTIAQEIAAREVDLTQEDNTFYDPETLSKIYRNNGGYRWGYRQNNSSQRSKKTP